MLRELVLILAAVLALIAGTTDWRWRRIPNWATVPGAAVGIAMNSVAYGWLGAKSALEGLGLGLLLLFPFVLIRALGAGDWKLVGALGAFLGPRELLVVLLAALLIAGLMALVLVIYKRRLGQTLRNIARIVFALITGHAGVPSVSLDNPETLKVPFGVAVAIAAVLFVGGRLAHQI